MPLSELQRLTSLRRFLKLDFTREAELQRIVDFAAELCSCPVALITILDDDKQHFMFKTGTSLSNTLREDAFCSYTIAEGATMVVADAKKDPRFSENPLVKEDPNIRFYAGAPLILADGTRLGSLCVLDTTPKELTDDQKKMLEILKDHVIMIMEFEQSLHLLKEQFARAKSSEIKIHAFFESSQTCHMFLDPEFKILHYNKAVSDFIKKNFGVLISTGLSITDFVHESYNEAFRNNFARALSGERILTERKLEYEKAEIWWEINYNPVYATNGQIIGVSYNATDISDRKKHEEKIMRQNSSLREIARIQSHEIRRPVASILGIVNLIKTLPDHEIRPMIDLLQAASSELDEKIHDIMDEVNDNEE